MLFQWNEEATVIYDKINLNQHEFNYTFDNHASSGYSTGTFPGVILRLTLKRNLSYHMLRTYLPSFLFVALAWFSMFIPIEHVPGRVTMSMTTLLTLASMFGSLSTITPPISYTTKLDVWMVGCIIFVFATLFEFTVVIFLTYYLADLPATVDVVGDVQRSIQAWVAKEEENANSNNNRARPVTAVFNRSRGSNANNDSKKDESGNKRNKADKVIIAIEKFSVFVFLFSFLTFNVFYWIDIVNTKNSQQEH